MSWIGHAELLPRLKAVVSSGGGTYLFHGPPSTGKRTVAFEVARAILCRKEQTFDECSCPSCKRFVGEHPDFLCVGRSGKLKVADIDQVIEFSSMAPFLSDRKVTVIDNAHDVTWEAANRLLKTLEEPSPGAFFILVTSDPTSILPTVRGRCVRVEFGALSTEDMTNVLWKKVGFDLPKARVLGWIASNTPSEVFSQAGSYLKYRDEAYGFFSTVRGRPIVDCMDYVDRIDGQDRQGLALFIDMLMLVLTDLMLLKNGIERIANVDIADDMKKAATPFNAKGLIAAVSVISQVKKNARLNVGLALPLKMALVKSHPMLSV